MTQLTATERPILWAVRIGGEVLLTGETPVGAVTVTSHDIIGAADEVEFLASVAGQAGDYNPLPARGEWCEGGTIYGYDGSLVICRQSHARTEHAPADIPALFAVYRVDAGEALEWVPNEPVLVGTRRLHEGVLYQCLQAHQTQVDQEPDAPGILGVLWGVVATTPEWAVGVLYEGDNMAGAGNGDVVTQLGRTFRCLQRHTSIVSWCPTCPGILGVLWVEV